jgi:hypothetical protein
MIVVALAMAVGIVIVMVKRGVTNYRGYGNGAYTVL